jgi:hypothetical protein
MAKHVMRLANESDEWSEGTIQCIPFGQFLLLQLRWLTIKHKPGKKFSS